MPIKLPVHQLSPAPTDSATMEDISPAILLGPEGVELDEAGGSIVGRADGAPGQVAVVGGGGERAVGLGDTGRPIA